MATVNAYSSLNMVNPSTWYGNVTSATSYELRISDSVGTALYEGYGLSYNSNGLVGGTITSYREYYKGSLIESVTGFSVPASWVSSYINAGNLPAFYSVVLTGGDDIYGSAQADTLRGFGGSDVIRGGAGSDVIYGDAGNDFLAGDAGSNVLYGDAGTDTSQYSGGYADFTIQRLSDRIMVNSRDGLQADVLYSVERLMFHDYMYAFDTGAAQVYRLYQAAFDRKPDISGVSYWVRELDDGASLRTEAASFINSAEFRSLYGSNPSNAQFVDALYWNVLDRAADGGGYSYWNDQLNRGLSRADVLVSFSESSENVQKTAVAVAGGVIIDTAIYLA